MLMKLISPCSWHTMHMTPTAEHSTTWSANSTRQAAFLLPLAITPPRCHNDHVTWRAMCRQATLQCLSCIRCTCKQEADPLARAKRRAGQRWRVLYSGRDPTGQVMVPAGACLFCSTSPLPAAGIHTATAAREAHQQLLCLDPPVLPTANRGLRGAGCGRLFTGRQGVRYLWRPWRCACLAWGRWSEPEHAGGTSSAIQGATPAGVKVRGGCRGSQIIIKLRCHSRHFGMHHRHVGHRRSCVSVMHELSVSRSTMHRPAAEASICGCNYLTVNQCCFQYCRPAPNAPL